MQIENIEAEFAAAVARTESDAAIARAAGYDVTAAEMVEGARAELWEHFGALGTESIREIEARHLG